MIDPRICNVAIDANALDQPEGDPGRKGLVIRLKALWSAGSINLIVPHGVFAEIQRPATPCSVKQAAAGAIYTIKTGLTDDERRRRQIIAEALQGNARAGRHAADAEHLAEAAKYGGYFITYDDRILNRSHGLQDVLGPALQVVNLATFIQIYDSFHPGTLAPEGRPDRRLGGQANLKQSSVVAIAGAIAEIRAAGREPDQWERVHLAPAISMVFRGAYGLATVEADNALVAPAKRSPNPNLPSDPHFDRCDLTVLNAALRDAEAEPVRDWPHFGRVVLTGHESSRR